MAPDPHSISAAALALLACPVCHGPLRALPHEITCAGCGRRYPVRDGIPVLIATEDQPKRDGGL